MEITMYADTACGYFGLYTPQWDDNMIELDIPRRIVKDYYEDYVLEGNEGMPFDKWIREEYVADDMEGLLSYAEDSGADMDVIEANLVRAVRNAAPDKLEAKYPDDIKSGYELAKMAIFDVAAALRDKENRFAPDARDAYAYCGKREAVEEILDNAALADEFEDWYAHTRGKR